MSAEDVPPTTPDEEELLERRARALAEELRAPPQAQDSVAVLEFDLASEKYAVELSTIREVHPLRDITPIPCTPPFVRGMVNLRGKILTIIDLKAFFGLPAAGFSDLNKVIVLHAAGIECGVLADTIGEVRLLPVASIQPPIPTLSRIHAAYLRGITARGLVVLDVAGIFSARELLVNDEPGATVE